MNDEEAQIEGKEGHKKICGREKKKQLQQLEEACKDKEIKE